MMPSQRATQIIYLMHLVVLSFYLAWLFGMILFAINMVSKKLQSASMCVDSTLQQIEGVMHFFDKYRDEGFAPCLAIAKGLAIDMGIEPSFPIKRNVTRKK